MFSMIVSDTMSDMIDFLQGNPDAFCFQDSSPYFHFNFSLHLFFGFLVPSSFILP